MIARMRSLVGLVGSAVIGLNLVGCVSSDTASALKMDRDQKASQLAEAQTDARTAHAEAEAYKNQRDALMNKDGTNGALVTNLMQENTNLHSQLEDFKSRYEAALAKVSTTGTEMALPQPLTNELNRFAAANPDLVDFDSARGIVKFKSDVTFAPGDANVTDKAADVINRFATILNSPAAASYELIVAGHTDNAPVHNPKTRAAGHKDNMYLSAHRAISVYEILAKDGVNPARMCSTGYGEMRPVAPNVSEAGKAQNRRVEVLILPTTVNLSAPAPTVAAKTSATPRTPRTALGKEGVYNKDAPSASVPNTPIINK